MIILDKVTGFDRDAGNSRKNDQHGSMAQAEEVFFNTPVGMLADPAHSQPSRAITLSGRQSTEGACISPSPCGTAAS
jgi:hypothetical protein